MGNNAAKEAEKTWKKLKREIYEASMKDAKPKVFEALLVDVLKFIKTLENNENFNEI